MSLVFKILNLTLVYVIFSQNLSAKRPNFLFIIADALPVSDPVPAVVGTPIIGAIFLSFALFQ